MGGFNSHTGNYCLIFQPSRITVKRMPMLYIYRSNVLAAKALRDMGCTLTPATKEVYDYDYNGDYIIVAKKLIYKVSGWKGSGKSFSRFLKKNNISYRQQKNKGKFTKEELELLHKALCSDIPDPTPYMAAQSLLNGDCPNEEEAWFYVRDYACYY